MRISTLSGVMSGNGQTTGDEEIEMKEQEINGKADIFKPDGSKEKAKIMELQQELFRVKQFGNGENSVDGNREGGMSYMLGLQGQKQSPGGLDYMLGNDKQKKQNNNKFDMFSMGGNKQTNKFDMFSMGHKNNTQDFFSGGKMKQKNNNVVSQMLGRGNVKRISPNNVNGYLKTGGNKNIPKQIAPKQNQNVAKINQFLQMGKTMQSTDNKIKNMLGSNLMGAMGKQKRAMNSMHQNPVEAAIGRVNMQDKLSAFGDFDRDGVTNILDCNPTNPHEQAWYHDFGRALKGGTAAVGRALSGNWAAGRDPVSTSWVDSTDLAVGQGIKKVGGIVRGDWAAGPDPAGAKYASQTQPVPPSTNPLSKYISVKSVSDTEQVDTEPQVVYSDTKVVTPKQNFMEGLQNVGAGLKQAGVKTPSEFGQELKQGAVNTVQGRTTQQRPTTLKEQLLQEQILTARQKRMMPMRGGAYGRPIIQGGLGQTGGAMMRTVRGAAGGFPGAQETAQKVQGSFSGVGIDASIDNIKRMSDIGGHGTGFYEATATMSETLDGDGGFEQMMGMPKMTGSGFNNAMGIKESEVEIPQQVVEQPKQVEEVITQQRETRPEFYDRIQKIRQLAIPQSIPIQMQRPVVHQHQHQHPSQQYGQPSQQYRQPQKVSNLPKGTQVGPGQYVGAGGKIVGYTREAYDKRPKY